MIRIALDEYLKSVFCEMFLSQGDDPNGPNEKGKFEEVELKDAVDIDPVELISPYTCTDTAAPPFFFLC